MAKEYSTFDHTHILCQRGVPAAEIPYDCPLHVLLVISGPIADSTLAVLRDALFRGGISSQTLEVQPSLAVMYASTTNGVGEGLDQWRGMRTNQSGS